MATYPRGIDCSNWQGAIDWAEAAGAGVEFAIVKASEGTWYRDAWFAENWRGIKAAGIAGRGAYHYAVPSRCAPTDEADYFVSTVEQLGGLEAGDVLALDLEDPQAAGDLADWTADFLARVSSLVGFRPLVYTSPSYATSRCLYNRPELGEYGLWLAHWGVPTPPPAPPPWTLVAIHQIGIAPAGAVPGVDGACDVDRFNGTMAAFALYGKPAEATPPAALPPGGLPVYDPSEPSHPQEHDWDCSVESIEWCLYAWGRTPDDDWLEEQMIAEGVVSPALGCLDATGAGLADFVNRHYASDGYLASNDAETTFDAVAREAGSYAHPVAIGGRGWYHWSAVAGFDPSSGCLLLRNPAPGWMGVGQTMTHSQWSSLGPWSLVRVTHPAAEGAAPTPEPEPEPTPPPSIWTETVGSGLLAAMAEDGSEPAQSASMWIGGPPAEVELCFAKDGTLHVWLLSQNQGFRFRPS